jgi:hypothetical protein
MNINTKIFGKISASKKSAKLHMYTYLYTLTMCVSIVYNDRLFIARIKASSTFKDQSTKFIIFHKHKKKNYIFISNDIEKVFDNIQYPLIFKTLTKIEIEGNFLNLIEFQQRNLQIALYLVNGQRLK